METRDTVVFIGYLIRIEFGFKTKIMRLWNYQRQYIKFQNDIFSFFLIFLKIKIPPCPPVQYYTVHLMIDDLIMKISSGSALPSRQLIWQIVNSFDNHFEDEYNYPPFLMYREDLVDFFTKYSTWRRNSLRQYISVHFNSIQFNSIV